ncbi:MAG: hypothetical protein ACJ789_15920 [Thermomicrobiales bacterium]
MSIDQSGLQFGAQWGDENQPSTGPNTPAPSPRPGSTPGSGMQDVRQPAYGQGIFVSGGTALAMLVLAIYAIQDEKSTGVPITETTKPLFWGLAVIAIVAAAAGAQFVELNAARAAVAVGQPRGIQLMQTAWAVPLVATTAAVMMIATYHNTLMLIAGPAIAFFGIAGSLLSRDLLDDATEATQRSAATIHTLVIHAIAFLALSAVYINKIDTIISAPLVGILSGILILEALERGVISRPTRVLYSLVGGMVMTELMVVLNWWPTHGWTGGAVLLVCFYLVSGLLVAHAQRSLLKSRDLVEYGLVSAVALLILAVTA